MAHALASSLSHHVKETTLKISPRYTMGDTQLSESALIYTEKTRVDPKRSEKTRKDIFIVYLFITV